MARPRLLRNRRVRCVLPLVVLGALVAAASPPAAAALPDARASTTVDAGVAAAADSDGDALLDDWELHGYDADGDGMIDVDLPAMGAKVDRKDIFVEMDYMGAETKCPCHLPRKRDLKRIEQVYAKSPRAENPDGSKGIRIHLDAGDARGAKYDLGGGNLVPHDQDLNPVNEEFEALKNDNFDPDRAKIFHYMIWGHGYGGGTSSGLSFGIGADSFIVTLGFFPEHGTSNAKVGTFVHELGHNLGLRHGGGDNTNYKPNYLSVMTYAFQIDGVPRTGSRPGYFSYSSSKLPPLHEPALVERDGLDDRSAKPFRTKWFCPAGQLVTSPGSANDPIDWNCDGSTADRVSVDVNSDGQVGTLTSHQDWGNLVFDGGTIGDGSANVLSDEVGPELTAEEYLMQTAR